MIWGSGIAFTVIPSDRHLHLKNLAKTMDDRRVEPVSLKDVQPLTRYLRGGVTALAAKRNYPVYLAAIATQSVNPAITPGLLHR
jgi:Cys-tRNA(Pro)/Cys-tRNA(Cys) deacylase